MLEKIKKNLAACEGNPNRCQSLQFLEYTFENYIKFLQYDEFVSIFEYAMKLNLPEEFKKQLNLEYQIRNIRVMKQG